MLKKIKLKDLTPFDKNPRVNDQAVDRVLESLKFNGYVSPIVVNEIGFPFSQHVIAAGHTRWKALQKFGTKEADVFVYKFESEKHFVRYNIEDNKTGEYAQWDEAILAELAGQFDIDLSEMGFEFEAEENKEGDTDPDDVPEVPAEPKAKLGQMWRLGDHRLLCGDSTDRVQVERLMGGEKADLLHTDPPYGINYGKLLKGKGGGKGGADKNGWKNYGEPEWDIERPNKEWYAIAKNHTYSQVVWGGNYFTDILPRSMGWLVWDKKQREFSLADGELAWTSFKNAMRIKTISRGQALQDGKVHPTQKPIELIVWAIECAERNYKKQISYVLDLFGGSGSTLIACEKTGRKCRMMELDCKYVDVIIKRWEDFTGNKAELINGTP